ncbi:MAG TPA: MMPL family transporter [Solirubrobacteraceae bacterium]|nr:MMPL family transporter [Solirubrobacteraceae bacterium]
MAGALRRLASWIARRPRAVIAAGLTLGALAGALGLPLIGELRFSSGDLDAQGSESVRAADSIERATGAAPAPTVFALVPLHRGGEGGGEAGTGAGLLGTAGTRQGALAPVRAVARELGAQGAVARVASYPQAAVIEKATLSRYFFSFGREWSFVAAAVRAGVQRTSRGVRLARRLLADFPPRSGIELGGSTIADEELAATARRELDRTELWLVALLAVLLLCIFRRAAAAGLPLLLGVLTLLETLAVLRGLHAAGVQLSLFALPSASGLSLGLGIDYSLLGVSRFREEVAGGLGDERAAAATLVAAGRTVLFSAGTIACCMATLMLVPVTLVFSVGLAVSVCACVAAANAVLLLPAVCMCWGGHLRTRARRGGRVSLRGAWRRLAVLVTRRPAPVAIAVSGLLLALCVPAFGLRFHGIDASALPPGSGARVAQETVERDFEPSVGDEIVPLLVRAPRRAGARVAAYRERVAATGDVYAASKARSIGRGLWEIDVVARGRRLSPGSLALVRSLRAGHRGLDVEVTGPAASYLDEQASLRGDLLAIVLAISLAAWVLLAAMTRSLVLPLKTLAMSGLTFAATFGLVVLLFQREPLMGLLTDGGGGELEASQPILMLGAVFGLTLDYTVFVLARIQEARRPGVEVRAAIAEGMAHSGPVVSAAALVFCVTVAAFATSSVMLVRETAAAMAIAVAIDATLVRGLLLPSLMALLGPYNWWLPKGLSRWLARASTEEWRDFSGTLDA